MATQMNISIVLKELDKGGICALSYFHIPNDRNRCRIDTVVVLLFMKNGWIYTYNYLPRYMLMTLSLVSTKLLPQKQLDVLSE